jgi:hypothetical protein
MPLSEHYCDYGGWLNGAILNLDRLMCKDAKATVGVAHSGEHINTSPAFFSNS